MECQWKVMACYPPNLPIGGTLSGCSLTPLENIATQRSSSSLPFFCSVSILRVCVLLVAAEPGCLLACLPGAAESRDGTTSNHKRGEEEQSVPALRVGESMSFC
uniref:Uncharacterized protein n=1 Tax=Sander lucioperca TaxID=283035 RepID=A0A8C9WXC7_SANLU